MPSFCSLLACLALVGSVAALPVSCPCFSDKAHVVYKKTRTAPHCHKTALAKKQEKTHGCLHCSIPREKIVSHLHRFITNLSGQSVPSLYYTQVNTGKQLFSTVIKQKPPPPWQYSSCNISIFRSLENFRL